MKKETRVEVAVIAVVAVLLGGWLGLKLIGSSEPETPPPPSTAGLTPVTPAVQDPAPLTIRNPLPEPEPDPAPATVNEPPQTDASVQNALAQAQALIAAEKLPEARTALTHAILAAHEGPGREQIKARLALINNALFFSRGPSADCVYHTIAPGDTLGRIAKKYGKDYYFSRLISQINQINPKRMRIGRKLKIPQGTFTAIIQKRSHRLMVFLNGKYIKEYRIGIGAPVSPTPEATFTVNTKEKNPNWYAPDGNVYKFGHPKNVLGTRWIGFKEQGQHQSYGIHGTADPSSVGKNVSNGCIRMLKGDVEELFSMLMVGDKVKIVR